MFSAVLAALVISDTLPARPATDSLPAMQESRTRSEVMRDDSVQVKFGAFVDGYYAWDSQRPATLDRSYTTQPARHNEFNINLAFIEATLRGPRVRGRLALQAGTAVQSNYSAEPRVGSISGGDLSRHLQEATIGVAVTPKLWVDAGVYFSYIGLEGWISRDNATYTRSLIADYTPYYLSGVKATWQATQRVSAQLHVMNGWQNMAETNSDKALGARVDWQVRDDLLLVWDGFVGNEMADSLPSQLRILQQLIARHIRGPWEFSLVLDGGRQARVATGADWWTGSSAIVRRQVNRTTAFVVRGEHLYDRGQVLVRSNTADGFRTTGASFGVDIAPDSRVRWRSEVRGFRSGDAIWPGLGSRDASRTSWMAVTSLALTL
ncbi:MAG: porin [Gemmatimonadaceae bacterium]|nr:porin [Gemmatimonadaceae bacterium]